MESLWFATHPLPPRPDAPFHEGAVFDVVVAGAGLTGLTTALLLARAGSRVAVLEARHVGAVTTGNTTAKVSLLQGRVLSEITRHHPTDVARAYLEANRAGQDWLLKFTAEQSIPHQRRDAWTYATTRRGRARLELEYQTAHAVGLEVGWTDETELPFPVWGAITLPAQAQLHPLEVLDAMLTELDALGVPVIEQARVVDVEVGSPVRVVTTQGSLAADRVVLATGTPILDRGGHFARLVPQRSYATSHRVPGGPAAIPRGMYLSVDDRTRSLRTVPLGKGALDGDGALDEGGELLMVGGNGHVTGRRDDTSSAVDDLTRWTREHFEGAERIHAWSAQDYQAVGRLPLVGPMAATGGRVLVATGFNKWGMTNAVAAALNLTARLSGEPLAWAATLDHLPISPAGLSSAVVPNAEVAVELAKDWVRAELRPLPTDLPAEGAGAVGRGARGLPEAVSTVDGETCRVSGVCTHLGGVLRWNDAERSWDCPLHGSRFAPDGAVLEGPAVRPLAATADHTPDPDAAVAD
ncbi:FAD-dependent oxidoreductase [Aestuariimicrobium ganziense]|uniref:FAD-dependent oxidoreductase n=1 Tax=Aestuariimicrobium ganziense TaxID=2773677 RepID=UPI001944AA61|nr:FAD-dependent oxidoreductase [Aestuariimicrobium ganziense]